jgi:TonB family protein
LIETILLMLVGATVPPPTAEPRLLNPQEVITDLDYPDEAMRRLEEGRVRALVRVGPAGSARECEIEQSSGSQSLDRQTCVLIKKRGRFDPAPAGTSDVRVAHVALRWTMPEKPWIRLSGWFSREQMRVEPSGAISSCTWRSSEGETGKCTPSIAFTPDLATRFAAMAGASPPEVIFESRFVPDGASPPVEPALTIFKRHDLRIVVNKDGSVGRCEATVSSVGKPAQELCMEARRKTFQESAQGVSTSGVYSSTIYVVKAGGR